MESGKITYIELPEIRRWTPEQKRMIDNAKGIVLFTDTPLAGRSRSRAKKKRERFFFSKELCQYIGCSLRHLYDLVSKRGLPYYALNTGESYKYYFRQRDVDEWLANYSGKGVQLGRKKSGLGDEPSPGLNQQITKQKDKHHGKKKNKGGPHP